MPTITKQIGAQSQKEIYWTDDFEECTRIVPYTDTISEKVLDDTYQELVRCLWNRCYHRNWRHWTIKRGTYLSGDLDQAEIDLNQWVRCPDRSMYRSVTVYGRAYECPAYKRLIYCGNQRITISRTMSDKKDLDDEQSIHLNRPLIMGEHTGFGFLDNDSLYVILDGCDVLAHPPFPGDYHESLLMNEAILRKHAEEIKEVLERAVMQMTGGYEVDDTLCG